MKISQKTKRISAVKLALNTLALLCLLLPQTSLGQSSRRSGKAVDAPLTHYTQRPEQKAQNIYMQIGKVVGIKDSCAIVQKTSTNKLNKPDGWTSVIFSTDLLRNPKSVLEESYVTHKHCSVYKIKEGSPAEGDLVIVMFAPPQK